MQSKGNNLPKVTIMIATYNQERFITEAIQSAMAQDYPNLEIVVSDDCSSDGTYKVAKEYEQRDPRVKVFRNKQNLGRVRNYHHLLYDLANGEWCVMLDGDDYYIDNSFLTSCISTVEQFKVQNVVACFAGFARYECEWNKEFRYIPKECLVDGREAFMSFPKTWLNHGSLLYKRKAAIDVYGYTDDILSADAALFLKLCLIGDIYYVPKCVYVWRIHEKNESIKYRSFQQLEQNEELRNSVGKFAAGVNGVDFKLWNTNQIRKTTKSAFIYAALHEDFKSRLELLKHIWRKYPFSLFSPETLLAAIAMVLLPSQVFYSTKNAYAMLKRRIQRS